MDEVSTAETNQVSAQRALLTINTVLGLTDFLFYQDPAIDPLSLDGATFDFVVVGAGTAGCVVASRLSEEDDCNVIIIESGPKMPVEAIVPSLFGYMPNSVWDKNITSQKETSFVPSLHQNETLALTQGTGIGGSDGIGYMVYVRGCPDDYDRWAELTNDTSWKYENILKYFKKSERLLSKKVLRSPNAVYHGTNGPIGVTKLNKNITTKYFKAIEQMGFKKVVDTNGKNVFGFTQPLVTIANGVHQSTCLTYLRNAKNRKNLRILTKATVVEILFDGNKRAKGVKVYLKEYDKIITINVAKEVIVSAGAFESPKLLLLSGVGPKEDLQSLGIEVKVDLPVGRNLQDHNMVPLIFKGLKSNTTPKPQNPLQLPVAIINGFVRLNESPLQQKYPDYEIVMIVNEANSPSLLNLCLFSFKYTKEVCLKIHNATKQGEVLFTFVDYLKPKSRGYVKLESKDFKDKPQVYLGYHTNKEDLPTHTKYVRDFSRILRTEYFKEISAKLIDPTNCNMGLNTESSKNSTKDEVGECYVTKMKQTVWHYCGTASMGKVTNSKCSVIGTQGLRVVDAACMPEIPRGNTLAPVIMLAEKIADSIKEDCRKFQRPNSN